MDSITITISDADAVQGWLYEAATREVDVVELLTENLTSQGQQLISVYGLDIIPGAEFVLRFSVDEIRAITEAAETDPQIAGLLQLVKITANISLRDPRLAPGFQYLVAQGIIAETRIAELTQRPERAVQQRRGPRRPQFPQ